MNTQLLCTFTSSKQLYKVIDKIRDNYNLSYNKIFILSTDVRDQLICTYNIETNGKVQFLEYTIPIHRKKATNTLFSINALNFLIRLINNGVLKKGYSLEWENYKNMLLITDNKDLNRIPIKTFDILHIKEKNT